MTPDQAVASRAGSGSDIRLSIHTRLAEIEQDWRAFEQHADCTVFQSFDWLSAWHQHIGIRNGVRPAVVIGRSGAGKILFMLPLAVERGGFTRRLTWLGSDLCDYNAPLLASSFQEEVGREGFKSLWHEIAHQLRHNPALHYDFVDFAKMPETVGAQPNPLMGLATVPNPSGAYLTHLTEPWEEYYVAKRSSATRRRDRTKRKRLGEMGEVQFVNPESADDVSRSLDILMRQKATAFARMGVSNLFAQPGYPDFYHALATGSGRRQLVHVSRLDVGSIAAAVNFGLVFRGCYYHVLASYDEGEVSRYGPGAAHLHDLMRYAIERGCGIFDFTIGDERYKRDWSDTEIKLHDHVAIVTLRGALAAFPRLAVTRIKRWIKQTPFLWKAFSASRAMIGALVVRPRGVPDRKSGTASDD